MTKIRVLFLVSLMAVSSLAFAQDAMKKGDKIWTDLEKTLEDVNNQWITYVAGASTVLHSYCARSGA